MGITQQVRWLLFFVVCLCCANAVGQQPLRNWSSNTGGYQVEARLVGLREGAVVLRKADGSEVTVPLTRLSDADVQYIEDAKKTAHFATQLPGTIGANGDDFWNYQPQANSSPASEQVSRIDWPYSQPLSSGQHLMSSDGSRSVLVAQRPYERLKPGEKVRGKLFLTPFDLLTGKAGAEFSIPECIPLGLSPSGRQLLAFRRDARVGAPTAMYVLQLSENETRLRAEIEPKSKHEGLIGAYFVDEEHLMFANSFGEAGVLNIDSKKVLWRLNVWPGSVPAIGAGGRVIVAHTPERLVVVDALTGEILGQHRSNPAAVRFMAINPAGTHVATAGLGTVRTWDLTTGAEQQNLAVASILMNPSYVSWLDNRHLLVGRGFTVYDVVDLEAEHSVCCYFTNTLLPYGIQGPAWLDEMPENVNNPFGFIATELPHAEGRSASAGPLLVDLTVGDPIRIELSAAPEYDAKAERRELEMLFTTAGYQVVESGAKATFHATLLPSSNTKYDDLDSIPDEAFIRRVELAIKDGDRIVWLALREGPLIDPKSRWSAYILPKVLKIPRNELLCWRLMSGGRFERAELKRSYEKRIVEHAKFSYTSGSGGR